MKLVYGISYFYLGGDSWFDQGMMQQANVTSYTKGYLGTVPWQPTALNFDAYDKNGLGEVYI